MIVGVCGHAGAGKDTVGEILVRKHGFVRVALADPMKRFCQTLWRFSDEQLWGPSQCRNAPDSRYRRPRGYSFPSPVPGAAWLPLSRGHALVDVGDFDRVVAAGPWWRVAKEDGKKTAYAKACVDGAEIKLHHFVIGEQGAIDHINGDGLDNRRSNLRPTDNSLNHANMWPQEGRASPFKGVAFDKSRQCWTAKITVNHRTINLGRFESETAAALAYDAAAQQHFGDHARLNINCFLTPRFVLQRLGTEFGRACDEDVWVRFALDIASRLLAPKTTGLQVQITSYTPQDGIHFSETRTPIQGVVITDVRFANELRAIKAAGGQVWRILRGTSLTGAAGAHVSETEQDTLADTEFDAVIDNAGTLAQLELVVDELANRSSRAA